MERMRRWWLERYSLDELREMAGAIVALLGLGGLRLCSSKEIRSPVALTRGQGINRAVGANPTGEGPLLDHHGPRPSSVVKRRMHRVAGMPMPS
jgi:hypothetical protein